MKTIKKSDVFITSVEQGDALIKTAQLLDALMTEQRAKKVIEKINAMFKGDRKCTLERKAEAL